MVHHSSGKHMQASPKQDPESGVAIIIALFFVIVVTGLVSSGTILMKSNTDRAEVRFRREMQADQFARSGLTESLSWLRRQTTQPVLSFEPQLNPVATIPIMDTEEPDIGLVREFQIANDIYGRYEVWKQWDADPDPVRLAYRQKYQCEDLSLERGYGAPGAVWLLRSVGYVFQKRDDTKAWNEAPNRILGMKTLECEVQRPVITLPVTAALSIADGNDAHINTKGKINGNGVGGIGYPSGSGTPTTGPKKDNRVLGSPALSPSGTYFDSIRDVFGVSDSELRAMADLVITDADNFPDPIPDYSIIYCDCGTITFDSSRGLNGTGMVFIRGNTKISQGNNSLFNGLLYVEGSYTQRQTSEINGAVVIKGNMTLQGSGTEAVINYDTDVLDALTRNLGQYRWSGAMRPVIKWE